MLLAALPGAAAAAPLTQKQIDKMTPEQINALPIVGMMTYAVPEAKARDVRAILEVWLARLGYYRGWPDGTDGPAFRRAVKDFQRATGKPATGILTFTQSGDLDRLMERFAPSEGLYLGSLFIYAKDGGLFAYGTWLDRGKTLPMLLNYSRIECHPETGCEESGFRAGGAPGGPSYRMELVHRHWTIAEAAPQRIVAKAQNGPCIDMTLTIDAAAQTAALAERPSASKSHGCAYPPEHPRDYDLADGERISKDAMAARGQARDEALDPAYRAMLEKLRKSPAWQVMHSLAILAEPIPK